MYDTDRLCKQMTYEEYEAGRDLFNRLRERGAAVDKAAGAVFRAGKLSGRKAIETSLRIEIGRLHEVINELKKSPPEAIEKGDVVNE